jgi:hypothetical protein
VFLPRMCFGVNIQEIINVIDSYYAIYMSQLSKSSTMPTLKKLLTILTLFWGPEGSAESTMVRSCKGICKL